ncbi:MAG: ABC transporter substrate-binding protein [Actinomycetota bacterium]|nr:ABC transporter substrate-binding protein [Actinomycetota bacterium]
MTPPGSLTRRRALAGLAALGAAAVAPGCARFGGEESGPASVAGGGAEGGADALRVQLAWTRGPQFTGTFVADRDGAFIDEGFASVTLLDGGPGLDPHTTVLDGAALYGTTGAQHFAAAVAGGAPLVALGAVLRRSPYGVVVAGNAGAADDISGARVGVPEPLVPLWRLAAGRAGLTGTESVLVDWSITALRDGEVDALVGFLPTVARKVSAAELPVSALGFDVFATPLPDELLVTSAETLESTRPALVRALRAEAAGWDSTLADPAGAVTTTVDVYAADLGLGDELVHAELERITPLVAADGSPLLTVPADTLAAAGEVLTELGHPVPPAAWAVDVADEAATDG